MSSELEGLVERYWLPAGWDVCDVFEETTTVETVPIHVVGLLARHLDGQTATGSAGDLAASPVRRAYFELIERTTLLSAECAGKPLLLRSRDGKECEPVAGDGLTSKSSDLARWHYAKSNGIAAGSSWDDACTRAELELVERDRLLRSWYGHGVPRRVGLPPRLPAALSGLYGFEAYRFDEMGSAEEVAGVFGFPNSTDAPFVCGFGARKDGSEALDCAAAECIQRLGFLWGETIPAREPEFAPTADYHQEFFLWPAAHQRIRKWLDGAHKNGAEKLVEQRPWKSGRRFADLTLPGLESKFFVAKALPTKELALVFGEGHPDLPRLPEALRVHPFC